jgi:hypothetical protein
LINPGTKNVYRVIGALVLVVALIEVEASDAVQGVVVSAGGVSLVGFLYLRSKFKGNLIPSIYAGAIALLGSIAILGALQVGPLTDLIYNKNNKEDIANGINQILTNSNTIFNNGSLLHSINENVSTILDQCNKYMLNVAEMFVMNLIKNSDNDDKDKYNLILNIKILENVHILFNNHNSNNDNDTIIINTLTLLNSYCEPKLKIFKKNLLNFH